MSATRTYGSVYDRSAFASQGSPGNERRLLSDISTNTQTVTSNVNRLEALVRQLGSARDSTSLRGDLRSLENDTRRIASQTVSLFRELAGLLLKGHKKARQQQMEHLNREFKMVIGRFHRIVQSYKGKIETLPDPGIGARFSREHSETSDKTALLSDQDEWSGQEMHVVQAREVAYEVAVAEERAEQIKQIEKDILEIQQIFRDLSSMVNEQGEKIDDIAANIDSTAVNVESANRSLAKSFRYQRTTRTKLCCILLIVLIGVLVVILAVVLSKRK